MESETGARGGGNPKASRTKETHPHGRPVRRSTGRGKMDLKKGKPNRNSLQTKTTPEDNRKRTF